MPWLASQLNVPKSLRKYERRSSAKPKKRRSTLHWSAEGSGLACFGFDPCQCLSPPSCSLRRAGSALLEGHSASAAHVAELGVQRHQNTQRPFTVMAGSECAFHYGEGERCLQHASRLVSATARGVPATHSLTSCSRRASPTIRGRRHPPPPSAGGISFRGIVPGAAPPLSRSFATGALRHP